MIIPHEFRFPRGIAFFPLHHRLLLHLILFQLSSKYQPILIPSESISNIRCGIDSRIRSVPAKPPDDGFGIPQARCRHSGSASEQETSQVHPGSMVRLVVLSSLRCLSDNDGCSNECKRRKLKCSGEPVCSRCIRDNVQCVYVPNTYALSSKTIPSPEVQVHDERSVVPALYRVI